MSKPPRNKVSLRLDDNLFAVKQRKVVPHEFVLDAIAPLSPETRSMFGCLAVYVEDKIVLILRDKRERDKTADNGVWLATTEEHHESLRHEFPNMRSIQIFGKEVTGWQVLPADAADFEKAALRACELIARQGPSNRQGTGGAAVLGIGGQESDEIPEAGEGSQKHSEGSPIIRAAIGIAPPCAHFLSTHSCTTVRAPSCRHLRHCPSSPPGLCPSLLLSQLSTQHPTSARKRQRLPPRSVSE